LQDRAGTLHVVAAVIVSKNLVLAGRRGPQKTEPGFWEFPGGKVEIGETSLQALRREIKEELNLEIEPLQLISDNITQLNGKRIRLETHLCEARKIGDIFSSDHDLFRWLRISELHQLNWCAPDLPAVRELANHSDTWTPIFHNL
jgi:8-oxo-dGTP diphosphatase